MQGRHTRAWLAFVVVGASAALGAGCGSGDTGSSGAAEDLMGDNPFLTESTLPYQMPPFDLVDDGHYQPAFEQGMADQLAEIEAIATQSDPPTFENTIVAMERSGRLLDRVATVFFGLSSAHTNDAMDEIRSDVAPKLSAHTDAILLDPDLFARVRALHEQIDTPDLDTEARRLIEEYYTDFVRAGALLDDAQKERMQAINAELASLSTTFSQNVLDEVNAAAVVVDTREELAGLPDDQVAAAETAAVARDLEGKFVIPLLNTSGQPVLASLEDRALRERITTASLARNLSGGDYDNRDVITTMARLRAERAAMLGYPNHATYILERQTAQTVDAVNERLASLSPPAIANAQREAADLQAMLGDNRRTGRLGLGRSTPRRCGPTATRSTLSNLRPYFELNNVIERGVFFAANQLYGLTFEARPNLPTYHPDVRVWEVFDADGSPLGLFLGDF